MNMHAHVQVCTMMHMCRCVAWWIYTHTGVCMHVGVYHNAHSCTHMFRCVPWWTCTHTRAGVYHNAHAYTRAGVYHDEHTHTYRCVLWCTYMHMCRFVPWCTCRCVPRWSCMHTCRCVPWCTCMHTCKCTSWCTCMCESQRTICGNLFSAPIMWVPGYSTISFGGNFLYPLSNLASLYKANHTDHVLFA